MKTWQKWLIAIPALLLCVAASQFAMRGRHESTGNVGYLGTEESGVEGVAGTIESIAVLGSHATTGSSGYLAYGTIGAVGNGGTASGVGVAGTGYRGVTGFSTSALAGAGGVIGTGLYLGVSGEATSTTSSEAVGVSGTSTSGFGVRGTTTDGTGVFGVLNAGGTGHAGYFQGRVHVNGTLSKSAGAFRIDHPLDPAGKYLSHSFVESPDMKNFYDGVATLEADGTATVELPEWFEALNKDFRYQLTCLGEHAPVYIAEQIKDNRFRIAGGYAGMQVSWFVTGTRNDPYAKAHRIAVEEVKPPHEAGRFLHPELYGQPLTQRVTQRSMR